MINEIQDKFPIWKDSLKVSLPQIVVIGGQDVGKSSTLENIVGREFLPRGSGLVTRRPTVVQLNPSDEEYATFSHKPRVKFTNFGDVKKEISEETDRVTGPTEFSPEPIVLHIYSPDVPKLTIVDLPGLIKVTTKDQSEDSPKKIRNMVLRYITPPESLIVATIAANADLSTSDALEIAQTVDPQRIRTIGVLTKLDLMDKGTDARDILENKVIPLKRGYVGVLNRSQQDNIEGKDIASCLENEEKFFATTPCYSDLASRMGTRYLRKILAEQLYIHIKENIPILRKELSQKLTSAHKELKQIKDNLNFSAEDPSGAMDYMIKLTQLFIEQLKDVIYGYNVNTSMDELSAGTMISYKLNKGIQKLKLPQVPSQSKLLTILANLGGIRSSFMMPSLALEVVFDKLLNTYVDPLNSLVNNISDVLDSAAKEAAQVLSHYPSFKDELLFLIRNSISEAAIETKETLTKDLQAQKYCINTYHKDFTFPDLEANESLFPMKFWQNRSSSGASFSGTGCEISNEADTTDFEADASLDQLEAIESIDGDKVAKSNANILAKTIENYIIIQHKHIEETVYKYILFFLVKRVMDFVKVELLRKILNTVDKKIIYKDCMKDFDRMRELETDCQYLEEALNTVQTF